MRPSAMPAFHKLSARRALLLQREYPRLLPQLLHLGLSLQDALALAFNSCLLFAVLDCAPALARAEEVLERFGLAEIAELCALYSKVESGVLEYSEQKEEL